MVRGWSVSLSFGNLPLQTDRPSAPRLGAWPITPATKHLIIYGIIVSTRTKSCNIFSQDIAGLTPFFHFLSTLSFISLCLFVASQLLWLLSLKLPFLSDSRDSKKTFSLSWWTCMFHGFRSLSQILELENYNMMFALCSLKFVCISIPSGFRVDFRVTYSNWLVSLIDVPNLTLLFMWVLMMLPNLTLNYKCIFSTIFCWFVRSA